MSRVAAFLAALWLLTVGLPAAAVQGPDAEDLKDIHHRLKQAELSNARVVLGRDGRVELVGEYKDRKEVQIAFSVAQSVVGIKWVAPTTPENIQYPAPGLAEALRAHLRKTPVLAPAAPRQPEAEHETGRTPDRYALVVGISEFSDRRINPLKYPAKDAEDVYRFLVSPQGAGFPKQNVTLLTNQKATRAGVEMALDKLAERARAGDIVMIYFSSHGASLNDKGNMNIVMYDTKVVPRYNIYLTSLTDDKLAQSIRALQATRLLIVMDTCYSGAAYTKVPGFLATGAKDLFVEEDKTAVQGVPVSSLRYLATGGKDLVVETAPVLHDGGQYSAAKVLISASDASEKSWESEQLHNSFFTYYLLDGIRKHTNVRDAYAYAKPAVSTAVQREKAATQTPQAMFLPADVDFQLTNTQGSTKGNQL